MPRSLFKRILVLSLCIATVFVMTACGGGGSSKTTYAGWFKANLPEGFEVANDYESEFDADIDGSTSKAKIQIDLNWNTTAEQEKAKRLSYADRYTDEKDIKAGDLTWKVVGFTWNDNLPSAFFYADVPGQEGFVAEITVFCRGADDEEILAFLESVEFVDDVEQGRNDFFDSKNSN